MRRKLLVAGVMIGAVILGLNYYGVPGLNQISFLNPVTVEAPTETHFEQSEVEFEFSFEFDEPVEYRLILDDEVVESFTISAQSEAHETVLKLDEGNYEWHALFETSNGVAEHSGEIIVDLPGQEEGSQAPEDKEDGLPDENLAEIGDELEGE